MPFASFGFMESYSVGSADGLYDGKKLLLIELVLDASLWGG